METKTHQDSDQSLSFREREIKGQDFRERERK